MPESSERVRVTANAAREGGINEDGRWPDCWCKKVVDQLGVVPGDGDVREGCGEHPGARRINLVKDQASAGAVRRTGASGVRTGASRVR
jgi:hypothetical protein